MIRCCATRTTPPAVVFVHGTGKNGHIEWVDMCACVSLCACVVNFDMSNESRVVFPSIDGMSFCFCWIFISFVFRLGVRRSCVLRAYLFCFDFCECQNWLKMNGSYAFLALLPIFMCIDALNLHLFGMWLNSEIKEIFLILPFSIRQRAVHVRCIQTPWVCVRH